EYDGTATDYTIELSVSNTCVYSLPQTGSCGIAWSSLAGIALMLAACWLYERRRSAAGQKG
ncbi:MAG: LPXTG cell wall anchor domain-containing protein, partial [Lachnospiraceae bacterium]|nr:LPXTG cell wall anchor domain-containing protein [Lachnospiraceae bacterium]